jgi:Nucleoside 2-deoxyribosyltransferase like
MADKNMKQCIVYYPPKKPENISLPSVFLAGSIEMNTADEWQNYFIERVEDLPVTVFNPRRPDFKEKWEQDIAFPPFKEQVDWEMDQLNAANVIALYFQPDTKSPISLLELGLYAASGKLIVCCPEGFWRRGNVQIVCSRYGIPMVNSLDDLIDKSRKKLIDLIKE